MSAKQEVTVEVPRQLLRRAQCSTGEGLLLEVLPGFWERAGRLRAGVLAAGRKARLADTLIAQTCIDHEVSLLTRDRDFRRFLSAGLKLLP